MHHSPRSPIFGGGETCPRRIYAYAPQYCSDLLKEVRKFFTRDLLDNSADSWSASTACSSSKNWKIPKVAQKKTSNSQDFHSSRMLLRGQTRAALQHDSDLRVYQAATDRCQWVVEPSGVRLLVVAARAALEWLHRDSPLQQGSLLHATPSTEGRWEPT